MSNSTLLSAEGIRKAFGGNEVLHGVNLTVHSGQVVALLGENGAGKSTLVKIIAGDYQPDSGKIIWDGANHPAITPLLARRLGIRMIFQELNDARQLTVAENIFLGEWPNRNGFVSWRKLRDSARRTLDELGAVIDIDTPVGSLRVGERQLVEIARAIHTKARLLILDEPTAALSASEVEQLTATITAMRARGVGIVFITHRLDEVLSLADNVVVLRDGVEALNRPIAEVSRVEMVSAMIGRDVTNVTVPTVMTFSDTPTLKLSTYNLPGVFQDVDLLVRPGEVVSLYGKIGSGTAEVAESIFGLHKNATGELRFKGKTAKIKDPQKAVVHGIGFLPPERQISGCFPSRSVIDNFAAPSWHDYSKLGFISRAQETTNYQRWRDKLGIRAHSSKDAITTLSGGNQQKVLLARWLERQVPLLILVEPTRGVDVGARADIYRAIREMTTAQQMSVLVATSDYEEVIQLSNRAIVMRAGKITRTLIGKDINPTNLTESAG